MRFIVTAIGSFSADCVVSSLKEKGCYVVGCDIYNGIWHSVSKSCDAFYQAPYATDEQDYVHFLLDTARKENIGYIIPLTDLEIDVLNKHRKEFSSEGIVLCIQSARCLEIVRNKWNLYNFFKDDELVNVPKSVYSEELSSNMSLTFPLIGKPINGRSSEGLCIISNPTELKPFSERPNYIIQERISGSVCTVDYVRDKYGNDVVVSREELLRTKNGAGITVRMFRDEMLETMVSYIGRRLDVLGCVNMEFIYHAGVHKYYLIDINPRFSAGIAYTKKVGYNMVQSHLNCFTDRSILPFVEYGEQIITKRYVEEVLWEKRI